MIGSLKGNPMEAVGDVTSGTAGGSADELERLKYAVRAANVGIWEWDIVHDRITWDDQMFQLYGIQRDDFGGNVQAWERGIHPDDLLRAQEALEDALAGVADFNLDFRVVWPDGTVKVLHASALIKRGPDESPIVMYGLNREITDEVRTVSELQEVNAYFQAAMDQSQVGIVIVDAPSGRVRFVNQAALDIPNKEREHLSKDVELHQYGRWQITSLDGAPIPNTETPLARSVLRGETVSEEVGIINANGEMRIVLTNTAPIRREDGSIRAGIAVFFDNTERHQLLEQLNKAREEAERASGAKSRFLDIAAHELRTPVTSFSLLLHFAQLKLDTGHTIDVTLIHKLRAQVDRLSRLVTDLLEVSRLDRGMFVIKRTLSDLGKIIKECVSNFQLNFPQRKFTITGNGTPMPASIDPVRIYQVVSNLIDNATKYTDASSEIEIIIARQEHAVRVSVRDHGAGIAMERRHDLFTPFERLGAGESEGTAGLGLGLYICRGIIALHDGTIGVEDTPGGGSTFFFELPLTEAHDESIEP